MDLTEIRDALLVLLVAVVNSAVTYAVALIRRRAQIAKQSLTDILAYRGVQYAEEKGYADTEVRGVTKLAEAAKMLWTEAKLRGIKLDPEQAERLVLASLNDFRGGGEQWADIDKVDISGAQGNIDGTPVKWPEHLEDEEEEDPFGLGDGLPASDEAGPVQS